METTPALEGMLNAFAEPAILLSRDYEILMANAAYRDVYGFDPARVAEPRCFRVSHGYAVPCDQAGESCPLQASLATRETSRVLHIHHTPRGEEYVNVEMWPIKDPQSGDILFFVERMHPSTAGTVQSGDEPLVGRSPAFQRMLDLVERVAPSDANVMLLGETGTGKEVVAETIHRLSERRSQAFVPVECTGLPDSLFESELFGYRKGAFTGATTDKTGLVAAANGGTLFLDEVGEVPLSEQVKLLRLLETRRYRPVGGTEWQNADFRLVCATNRDLAAMVESGEFRQDLYFRLNVFDIRLPPLRERTADLELLIETILFRLGKSEYRLDAAAVGALGEYGFPGNVRELRNILERATLLADDRTIGLRQLPDRCCKAQPDSVVPSQPDEAPRPDAAGIVTLAQAESDYLRSTLSIHKGSRRELAAKLGISERALYRKLAAAESA